MFSVSVGVDEGEAETESWRELGTCPEFTQVYAGQAIQTFYNQLFTSIPMPREGDEDPTLILPTSTPASSSAIGKEDFVTKFPDCTWLRIRGRGDVTVEHTDYYYFKQETTIFSDHWPSPSSSTDYSQSPFICQECKTCPPSDEILSCSLCHCLTHKSCLPPSHTPPKSLRGEWHCNECANAPFDYWTCWIALGDVGLEDGRLAILPRTHRTLSGYSSNRASTRRLPDDYKRDEKRDVWLSENLKAGDLILFNIKTVHAASENSSERFRISCDTRLTTCQGGKLRKRERNNLGMSRGRKI